MYKKGRPVCAKQTCGKCCLVCRLVEQFGSTRRKRQLTAKENAVVSADAVGGAAALQDMLKTAADKAADTNMTKDDIINQTQALRAIPPHHPDATQPHDAYRCCNFVPLLLITACIWCQYQSVSG